jgi:hypothetical protein
MRREAQQRCYEAVRFTALAVQISLDAAILVRQPLLENVRTLVAMQTTQWPPHQQCNDICQQHDDSHASRQRDRGRELLSLQGPDCERGDCKDACECDGRGARIDMSAQAGAQGVQVTFESLSSAHFGVSRRIAR